MRERLDSKFSWVALKMIPKLGNITYKTLIDRFGSPDNVFSADLPELVEKGGLKTETAKRIISRSWDGDPEVELRKLKKIGARIITILDSCYPKDLKEIYDPPPFFYLRGNDIPLSLTIISVVGSRNPSHYGLKITEDICQGLAMKKIIVASGMAQGIDSAAHWGCLRRKGFTIAVLGSGVDVIYPRQNFKLYNSIIEQGAVITEFPIGSPPESKNFPIRNRIISGLSKGVVVVEASKKSGSLITASLALEQGREIFAVPGSIESFKSTGTHFLIKQGAKLVENANDILEELGLGYYNSKEHPLNKKMPLLPLEEDEKRILNILGHYPIHIDTIAGNIDMEPAKVAGLLTKLELKGVIRQLPGKMFIR